MTTAIHRVSPFRAGKTTRLKEQWDNLQGQEHGVDYERARLLHEVFLRLDRSEELLVGFLVGILGEYPGKRPKMFVRFVEAFEVISEPETWAAVGGKAAVLLSRTNKRKRRRVMTRVRRVLARTGRKTVSTSTFRTILRDSLGDEAYRACLLEPTNMGTGARAQLKILKGFILALVKSDPKLKKLLTRPVKKLLGADLFE